MKPLFTMTREEFERKVAQEKYHELFPNDTSMRLSVVAASLSEEWRKKIRLIPNEKGEYQAFEQDTKQEDLSEQEKDRLWLFVRAWLKKNHSALLLWAAYCQRT